MESRLLFHHVPTRVMLGSMDELGTQLGGLLKNCLVVSGRRFARMAGLLDRVDSILSARRIKTTIFDAVEPNPAPSTVRDGADIARKARARWILAIGGGSAIDAAKAIALVAVNQGRLKDFAQGMRPENKPLPIVAIPTTAGTGTEVTPYSVLTDVERQDKFSVSMPELFPVLAVLDPELTLSMPESVTVDSGLDALCHALEALFSLKRSDFSDLLAIRAVELVIEWLPRVRAAGDDLHARAKMQIAACLAGMAIADTGTLLPHAMGYPVTIRYGITHGRATALLEPVVLEEMASLQPDRYELAGRLLGGRDAAESFRKFVEGLGVAPRASAYGMRDVNLEQLVDCAVEKKHLKATPGEWNRQKLLDLYRRAF